jgi:Dolichyl-phosphate-mannose-protein mannosyltransferase
MDKPSTDACESHFDYLSKLSANKWLEIATLLVIALLLASHWLHLSADPNTNTGWLGVKNGSIDFYTDEGLDAGGAIAFVLRGHWYLPGDFNLFTDAPLWPLLLGAAFKVFGFSIVVARALSSAMYVASVVLAYILVRRREGRIPATGVAALLAANIFALTFSHVALMEAAWVFFLVVALAIAQEGALSNTSLAIFVAGLFLGFSVLTKLTGLAGLAPIVAMLYLNTPSTKLFVRRAASCCAGFLVIVLPCRLALLSKYPLDHQLYTRINISARAVKTLRALVYALLHVSIRARAIDPVLYIAFLLGGVWMISAWIKGRKPETLVKVCLIWLAANMVICSTVTYFPPRYTLSFLFPITIMAVVFTRDALKSSRRVGYVLIAILSLSWVTNIAQTIIFHLRPVYSFDSMCGDIKSRIDQDGVSRPQLMGVLANTISLYTAVPSLNDDLGTTVRAIKIMEYRPDYYVSLGPATHDAQVDLRRAGADIALDERFDVFNNYATHQPVYLYSILWPRRDATQTVARSEARPYRFDAASQPAPAYPALLNLQQGR